MAAHQIRQFDDLELDLRRYLEQILLELSNCSPADAARVSNIAPPKKPANRPKNAQRIAFMLTAWEVARASPTIEQGDEDHIKVTAEKISKVKCGAEQYAQSVDLLDELAEAEQFDSRYANSNDTFKLAANIFNHLLAEAQKCDQRMSEATVTPSAIKAAVNRARKPMV